MLVLVLAHADILSRLDHLALSGAFSSHLRLPLGELLLTLNSWPVDTISNRLSRSTEDWERIQPKIIAKDLLPVFRLSNIILRFELLALFVKVFNSCLVFSCKHQMELQEGSHEAHYDKINHEPDDNLNL